MSKGTYIGIDNKARKVTKCYIGINGIARKIKKAYIGVNGIAQAIFGGVTWKKYSADMHREYYQTQDNTGWTRTGYIYTDTTTFYSGYSFSESNGFTFTGAQELSPFDAVGMYWYHNEFGVDQVVSAKAISTSPIGHEVTYTRVASCNNRDWYTKGTTYYGEVTADEDSLPEEGTLHEGSIEGDYCVININGTDYYYEKVV